MEDVRKELIELKTVQVVVISFLVIMLEGFDIQAAGVTMRKLATEFQLDKMQMGYFASSSAVGVLLFAAIGGIIADRYGRKPTVIAATALFGLACRPHRCRPASAACSRRAFSPAPALARRCRS